MSVWHWLNGWLVEYTECQVTHGKNLRIGTEIDYTRATLFVEPCLWVTSSNKSIRFSSCHRIAERCSRWWCLLLCFSCGVVWGWYAVWLLFVQLSEPLSLSRDWYVVFDRKERCWLPYVVPLINQWNENVFLYYILYRRFRIYYIFLAHKYY